MVSGGRQHGTTQAAGYDVGQSGHGTLSAVISKLKCGATLFCGIFFCLVCGRFNYTLSRKKVMIFGDVGSISDNIFYMGTQNGSRLEKC